MRCAYLAIHNRFINSDLQRAVALCFLTIGANARPHDRASGPSTKLWHCEFATGGHQPALESLLAIVILASVSSSGRSALVLRPVRLALRRAGC
jgi:hypothetical protein